MRHMSFMLTTPQMHARTKTVTRRVGWKHLRPGDTLLAIEKGQGLKRGEKVKPIGQIRIVSVRQQQLSALIARPAYGAEEARKEGFPHMDGEQFLEFFLDNNPALLPRHMVTRIEFEHIDPAPVAGRAEGTGR